MSEAAAVVTEIMTSSTAREVGAWPAALRPRRRGARASCNGRGTRAAGNPATPFPHGGPEINDAATVPGGRSPVDTGGQPRPGGLCSITAATGRARPARRGFGAIEHTGRTDLPAPTPPSQPPAVTSVRNDTETTAAGVCAHAEPVSPPSGAADGGDTYRQSAWRRRRAAPRPTQPAKIDTVYECRVAARPAT